MSKDKDKDIECWCDKNPGEPRCGYQGTASDGVTMKFMGRGGSCYNCPNKIPPPIYIK